MDFDLFRIEPLPPPLAEKHYVGDRIRLSGFGDADGEYVVTERKPLADSLKLTIERVADAASEADSSRP